MSAAVVRISDLLGIDTPLEDVALHLKPLCTLSLDCDRSAGRGARAVRLAQVNPEVLAAVRTLIITLPPKLTSAFRVHKFIQCAPLLSGVTHVELRRIASPKMMTRGKAFDRVLLALNQLPNLQSLHCGTDMRICLESLRHFGFFPGLRELVVDRLVGQFVGIFRSAFAETLEVLEVQQSISLSVFPETASPALPALRRLRVAIAHPERANRFIDALPSVAPSLEHVWINGTWTMEELTCRAMIRRIYALRRACSPALDMAFTSRKLTSAQAEKASALISLELSTQSETNAL